MAKAIHVTAFAGEGYLDHVSLVDVPVPEPAESEVLVQIFLRPVHLTDLILVKVREAGRE